MFSVLAGVRRGVYLKTLRSPPYVFSVWQEYAPPPSEEYILPRRSTPGNPIHDASINNAVSAKLLSRSNKIAHMLLTKVVSSGKENKAPICKPGDRVALVYPNTEPLAFLPAFYGCLIAGVVPVPIEVPMSKRVCIISVFSANILTAG